MEEASMIDEHIIDIPPTLYGRQLNVMNNYAMNRTNGEKVHAFIINY